MDLRLACNSQKIDSQWVADAITHLGVSKFMDLNPWARELVKIPKSKKKPLTDEQRHLKEVMAHHWRELGLDLRSKGWSVKDVAQLGIQQKKISRRQALDARKRAKVEVDVVQSSPRSTILDTMYRFDKPPRVRHYDRKKKMSVPMVDAETTISYPDEKLDERRAEIEKALYAILLLYQAGELSRMDALATAKTILEKYQLLLIQEINEFYAAHQLAGQLQPEAEALKKSLSELQDEFERALDTKDEYWASSEGLKQSAGLLAIMLAYTTASLITLNVAQTTVTVTLRWKTMLPAPGVCETCEELEGTEYPPSQPPAVLPGEIHEGCRCKFLIVWREAA